MEIFETNKTHYPDLQNKVEKFVRDNPKFTLESIGIGLEPFYKKKPDKSTISRTLLKLCDKYNVKSSKELHYAIYEAYEERRKNFCIDTSVEGFYSNPNLTLITTETFGADKVMHSLSTDTNEIIGCDLIYLKVSDNQILVISPTQSSKNKLQDYLHSRNKIDFDNVESE